MHECNNNQASIIMDTRPIFEVIMKNIFLLYVTIAYIFVATSSLKQIKVVGIDKSVALYQKFCFSHPEVLS